MSAESTGLTLGVILLMPIASPAQTQPSTTPCEVAEIGATPLAYNYNGGLGKSFSLQLQRPQPSNQQSRQIECSSADHDFQIIDCSIKGFSGTMHVGASDENRYFAIPSATDVQLTIRTGMPIQCSVRPADAK